MLWWSSNYFTYRCSDAYIGQTIGRLKQSCQMVYFQTQNPYLGKFWKVLQWKMLVFLKPFCLFYGEMVYFMAIWYSLWSFGIFCGHLVYFFKFWYVVARKIWQPWFETQNLEWMQVHMWKEASRVREVRRKVQTGRKFPSRKNFRHVSLDRCCKTEAN
jgi:hypothetical protein